MNLAIRPPRIADLAYDPRSRSVSSGDRKDILSLLEDVIFCELCLGPITNEELRLKIEEKTGHKLSLLMVTGNVNNLIGKLKWVLHVHEPIRRRYLKRIEYTLDF